MTQTHLANLSRALELGDAEARLTDSCVWIQSWFGFLRIFYLDFLLSSGIAKQNFTFSAEIRETCRLQTGNWNKMWSSGYLIHYVTDKFRIVKQILRLFITVLPKPRLKPLPLESWVNITWAGLLVLLHHAIEYSWYKNMDFYCHLHSLFSPPWQLTYFECRNTFTDWPNILNSWRFKEGSFQTSISAGMISH